MSRDDKQTKSAGGRLFLTALSPALRSLRSIPLGKKRTSSQVTCSSLDGGAKQVADRTLLGMAAANSPIQLDRFGVCLGASVSRPFHKRKRFFTVYP
ncbi:hypothetical protein B1694_12870 [Geobacillus zalihae]|nr:hypothetical protein B1693_13735 [Geobacillus zalihae]OQP20851.1 hypothetical protein B1694_12870 [Geobacillus zalihae]